MPPPGRTRAFWSGILAGADATVLAALCASGTLTAVSCLFLGALAGVVGAAVVALDTACRRYDRDRSIAALQSWHAGRYHGLACQIVSASDADDLARQVMTAAVAGLVGPEDLQILLRDLHAAREALDPHDCVSSAGAYRQIPRN